MSAPAAAEIAGVTYRQLDHWERKGWIHASVVEQIGGRRVRRYTIDDVVRLAALRHLATSGLEVGSYGPQLTGIEIPDRHVLIVGDTITIHPTTDTTRQVTTPGRWTVFDPAPTRRACTRHLRTTTLPVEPSAATRSVG